MKIKSLELDSFRNYDHLECHFEPELNIFIGANAQGKTNLLESMAFLSSLRSFRNLDETSLIQSGKTMSRIRAVLSDDHIDRRMSVMISKQGKTLRYQNQLVRKTSEFIGLCNVVLFSPADMTFFDDSPRVRRKYMDLEAGKLSRLYLSQMVQFNKLLKERNALLKQFKVDEALLDILTGRLIKSQLPIVRYRRMMVEFLNSKINAYFEKLSDTDLKIEIVYKEELPDVKMNDMEVALSSLMKDSFERDMTFKATQRGLHRDDFIFMANDVEISQIASQGQKRLTLLAFKLAMIDFIIAQIKTTPILLLDDVFSELDTHHQQRFLEVCPKNVQTLITATHLDVLKDIKSRMCVFTIVGGQIQSRRLFNG